MNTGLSSLFNNQQNVNSKQRGLESFNLSLPDLIAMNQNKDIDNEEIQADTEDVVKDNEDKEDFSFGKIINMVPPNVRLMAQDVFNIGDNTKVFTEKNLNKEYKDILKDIAFKNIEEGKNIIDYEDYKSTDKEDAFAGVRYNKKGLPNISNKKFNLKTTLGRASIEVDKNDNVIITDRFNFNDSDRIESFSDVAKMFKEIGGAALRGEGYHTIRKVGKWFGSGPGEGQLIKINLGKINTQNNKRGGRVMKNYNKNYNTQRFI